MLTKEPGGSTVPLDSLKGRRISRLRVTGLICQRESDDMQETLGSTNVSERKNG